MPFVIRKPFEMLFFEFAFLSLCLVYESVSGANILFVTVVPSPSHHIWNEVLVAGLLENGHKITLIGHQDAKIPSENYTVLKIDGMEEIYKQLNMNDLINNKNTPIQDLYLLWDYIIGFAELDLNSKALQKLLDYPRDSFDLIVFDIVCGHYLYPLINRFGNPPVIATSPFALPPYILDSMGSEFYSYLPIHFVTYTDRMGFYERFENMVLHMTDYYLKYKHMPILYQLAKERFDSEDVVPFEQVERQFQLLLTNYDPTLDFPVPLPPFIIPVGGLHTKRSTALPQDLMRILNEAKEGVIYFSFGTNVEPSSLSVEKKNIFLKTFSRLKQIVLWKYDSDDLENVPDNVIIKKWYSQNNILGHKNVKLFITHGGGLSTRESMYHGVPVVAIPLFMDQRNNAEKMQIRKLGKTLLISELTENSLYETIQEVLHNPIYKQNIKKISQLFRDQKETPLERAVFWVEYTLRNKNLSHLWTSSRDMNVYERQNLDIFGFTAACVFVFIIFMFLMLKCIFIFCTSEKNNKIKTN